LGRNRSETAMSANELRVAFIGSAADQIQTFSQTYVNPREAEQSVADALREESSEREGVVELSPNRKARDWLKPCSSSPGLTILRT